MIKSMFADFFFVNSNNLTKNKIYKSYCIKRLSNYVDDPFDSSMINVELLKSIIKRLKKCIGHGIDILMVEHLQLRHPLVVCRIIMLFNLMIKLN